MRRLISVALFLILIPDISHAQILHSREEALRLAFPGAERIETVNLYLTASQRQTLELATGAAGNTSLYTFYIGYRDGRRLGIAAIESAPVRTQLATLLVVLNPDLRVRLVEVMAFFEPSEYSPSPRWLAQFAGRTGRGDIRLGTDLHGITGATLSTQAVLRQVRKTTAMATCLPGESLP